jgi:putative transposase
MTYWRLHYHLIWSTFGREPSITLEREKLFYGVLYKKGKELDLKIHSAGNVDDHVHVVISIPPKFAVADCVRHLKGASAYAINHMEDTDGKFKWQEGYGALTVGEGSLENVMAYAANRKQHHMDRSIVPIYEKIDEEGRGKTPPLNY